MDILEERIELKGGIISSESESMGRGLFAGKQQFEVKLRVDKNDEKQLIPVPGFPVFDESLSSLLFSGEVIPRRQTILAIQL